MWYDSNWQKRRKITIDSTKVAADLTDFPVYIDLSAITGITDPDAIRVTKADGVTEVPREIVSASELHFKADGTLSSSSDTDFYIYYDNPSASDYADAATYGSQNVWTKSYGGVWHFEETSGTTFKNSQDSVVDGSTINSPTWGSGKIGNTLQYDASSNQYAKLASGTTTSNPYLTTGSEFVITGWVNSTGDGETNAKWFLNLQGSGSGVDAYNAGLSVRFDGTGSTRQILVDKGVGLAGGNNEKYYITTNTISANEYHLVKIIHSGSTVDFYVDGVFFESGSIYSGNINWDGSSYHDPDNTIGTAYRGGSPPNYWWEGGIDEVSIQNSVTGIGADWAETEYNSQNSPSTFYTAGAEEVETVDVTINASALQLTSSLPIPEIRLPVTVKPDALTLDLSVVGYTIETAGNVIIKPSALQTALNIPTSSVYVDMTVDVTPLLANLAVVDPTIYTVTKIDAKPLRMDISLSDILVFADFWLPQDEEYTETLWSEKDVADSGPDWDEKDPEY